MKGDNMNEVYFKAIREKKKIIQQWQRERTDGVLDLIEKTKEMYGGVVEYHGYSAGITCVIFKNQKDVDMAVWKKGDYSGFVAPRARHPEGKKIKAMLDAISVPCPMDLRRRMKLMCVGGMGLNWAGQQPYIVVEERFAKPYREEEGLVEVKASTFFKAKERVECES